jgi:hypothetical protein
MNTAKAIFIFDNKSFIRSIVDNFCNMVILPVYIGIFDFVHRIEPYFGSFKVFLFIILCHHYESVRGIFEACSGIEVEALTLFVSEDKMGF